MSSGRCGGGGGGRRPAERSTTTTTLILLTTAAAVGVVVAAAALAFYNTKAAAAIKDSDETLTTSEESRAAVTNGRKEDGQFQDMNKPVEEEEEEEDEELVKVQQPQQIQEVDSASAAADSKNSISPVAPSGAKNEEAALVTPAAPTTTSVVYCWHGSLPRTDEHVQGMKRAEALRELLHALQITVKAGLPFSATMKTFVTEPEIRPLVDEHLIQCVLAHATDEVLQQQQGHGGGDVRMARLFVSISMALEAAVGRIDEFAQVLEQTLNGQQQHNASTTTTTTPEWYQTWNSKSVNIVSEKDIILYLHERIPCNCLDEKVRQIHSQAASSTAASSRAAANVTTSTLSSSSDNNSSKMMSCLKCGKRDLESKLFICGQCKIVRYCSKDCQWQDWKEHRKVCSSATTATTTATTTNKQQPGE